MPDTTRPESGRASDPKRRVRRRLNPATCTEEELIAHLATDPATGLSHKEARRRQTAITAVPLYRTTDCRFSLALRRVLREPALWMLLGVSLISLFFSRVVLGLVCLLLTVGYTLLCAGFLLHADRVDAAMQVSDTPLSRVRRGGRWLRIPAAGIVKGDILTLMAGDMIPADCRLLSTENFAVSERPLDATHKGASAVSLLKDAAAMPDQTGNFRYSPVNMVFAGGVVESGTAVAAVVAVGSETHLGGLVGGVDPAHPARLPRLCRDGAKWLSYYNVALVCLLIPVIAIGIFTLGRKLEFLDIFLASLSLSTVTLTEHMLARGIFALASARRAAATDRDAINTADIKTSPDAETLTTVTDLFLVGSAALHDGIPHPVTLQVDTTVYQCDAPEADEYARALAELLYLYRHGLRELSPVRALHPLSEQSTLDALITALTEWAELDTDAALLRLKEIRPEDDGISAIFPTADGNRRLTVRLTDDATALCACHEIFSAGPTRRAAGLPDTARPTPADEHLEALLRAYDAARREGLSALFVMTRTGNRETLRAMLTYAPAICRKTEGNIRSLEAAGIRVTAFLHNEQGADIRALTACGFGEITRLDREAGGKHPPLTRLMDKGARAFVGCSEAAILEAVRDLRTEGRVVAVLATEGRDLAVLDAADLPMTCAPSLFAPAYAEDGRIGLPLATCRELHLDRPDGTPDSPMAPDLARRRAAVIVRRTSREGGGLGGVRRALVAADHAKATVDRVYRFLLLSQLARVVGVLFPLCLGLATMTAPALLVSGFVVDTVVLLCAMHLPLPTAPVRRRRFSEGLDRPWITLRREIILTAVAAALPWVAIGIITFIEGSPSYRLPPLTAVLTFALQWVLLCTDPLPRRNRTAFLGGFALILVYIGSVAAAIAADMPLWRLLIIPLISPLAYALGDRLTRRH